jgi:hypothetical protein
LFTLMVKVAVPVMLGEFRYAQVKLPPPQSPPLTPPPREAQVAHV